MPSCVRRREIRQCLGVNRKVSTFRWIGRQTVGVCQLVRAPRLPVVVREKAEDGAEKSFRRCKRRRQRGQRRGKRRSREDKSRSSSPRRPPAPKGVSARCINHSGRKFIWGERARSRLVNSKYFRALERSLPRNAEDDREGLRLLLSPSWTSHLRTLRCHARKLGIPDGANPFEKSAVDFVLTNTSLGGEMAFHDILGGLKRGVPPAEFHALTVQADEDQTDPSEDEFDKIVAGTSPSETPVQGKKWDPEKNLAPGMRRMPIVRPAVSGIVRPWNRRGANNRQRSHPS